METINRRLRVVSSQLFPGDKPVQVRNNCSDIFDHITQAPPNEIFNTKAMFAKDTNPNKINLGIGAYRNDDGKPIILDCVKKAEALITVNSKLNKEYLGITGDAEFCRVAFDLAFGKHSPAAGRTASIQGISGTGSLRLGGEFIKEWMSGRTIYTSAPTWGNHKAIFSKSGLTVKSYTYWNPKTKSLNIEGMLSDLSAAPRGSVIVLHGCAHNPTGVDPTREQWRRIAQTIKQNGLFPFFDIAYQGFASGDLENDAFSLRYFVDQGFELVLAQSFAKNFGLYGERAGCFHVVTKDGETAKAVKSRVSKIIRPMYSNPPKHGAEIVRTVLNSPELTALWKQELLGMSLRIQKMRKALYDELVRLGTPGGWTHITSQIGMFSFTGLSASQVEVLISKWHIYLLKNGRISMAGINSKNVKYMAKAMDDVVRNVR